MTITTQKLRYPKMIIGLVLSEFTESVNSLKTSPELVLNGPKICHS